MTDSRAAVPAPARSSRKEVAAPGALPAHAQGLMPGEARPVRRILLATDLSASSERATDQAISLSRDLRADLLVVSVIDPLAHAGPGLVEARMDQRRTARELAAQKIVAQGRRAGVRVEFLVWQGEPGPAILEAADAEHADLVIVGTRGRNRVERLVLGSVSDHVVRNATCPILIVRG